MRTARERSQHDIYHVVSRGTGKQLIFEDDDDRLHFLGLLKKFLDANGVLLYAWCLMGNHVHLLMRADLDNVSRCMKQLCGTYAQDFNQKTGRVGHLFQERFKSEPINDESYLLTVIRYIHDNPSKASIAPMDEYRWSSFHEYVEGPELCDTEFILSICGGVDGFLMFHGDAGNAVSCLDVSSGRSRTRALQDSVAISIAEAVLGPESLENLKALPAEERNEDICRLKNEGLSIRQIQRLTGIGRNVIQRASSA